ncbi:hypothetical protein J1614_009869 [Plenodomus biglobosus]|nr:hypothetical protein J1614_009869 [Plenodomus biglobosus]
MLFAISLEVYQSTQSQPLGPRPLGLQTRGGIHGQRDFARFSTHIVHRQTYVGLTGQLCGAIGHFAIDLVV